MAEPTHPTSYYAKPVRYRSLVAPRDEFWPELGLRIAFAGGIFPVFVVVVWALVGLSMAAFLVLTGTASDAREFGLVAWPLGVLLWFPLIFGLGFVLAAVLSMVVLPSVAWALRLLEEPPHRDRVAILCGSTVASLAMLPFSLATLDSPRVVGVVILILHLGTAIAFGQAAGGIASLYHLRRTRGVREEEWRLRVSLFQVLAAMIPLALGLSLLKTLDLPVAATVAALLLAVALHFCTRRPVAWLVNRWADRRLRRRREQRLAARST